MGDAVVNVLLEKLIALVENRVQIVLDFPKEFESMKEKIEDIERYLRDVDKTRVNFETLSGNINKLREVMYDAEDIMAEYAVSGISTSSKLDRLKPRSYKIGKHLKDINEKIKNIRKDMPNLQTAVTALRGLSMQTELAADRSRWSVPLNDESQIVGLKGAIEKIKGWIFEPNENRGGLTYIGFVGMGGSGKTTLAEMVQKDKKITAHFDRKIMFVTVSQHVDEEKIMSSMLKQLGDTSSGNVKREMSNAITEKLKGNRYFLILDDVWSRDRGWWERLEKNLPKQTPGSCVVITSRDTDVVKNMGVAEDRIHEPEPLSNEDGWTLFSKCARINDVSIHDDLKDIGKEIVRKCGGLPLTISVMGGLVSSKNHPGDWKQISKKFMVELLQNDDRVTLSLKLSYDELPKYLKPCLLCFSIFPEDCTILRDELTRWWIGEGFVPLEDGRLLVESANVCFMGLVNRCLIQVVERDYNGKVHTCKMHDLVRDMVIKVGEREAFCPPLTENGNRREDRLYRHMSINVGDGSTTNKMSTPNTKFRAVVSVTNQRSVGNVNKDFLEKICSCKYLRVLDLSESMSETHFKDMLSKIDTLRHLTYLNLRNAHPMLEVPPKICKLQCLLVLDLSFCHCLQTLPSCITNLKQLMILDVTCCGTLKYLPKGLGSVSSLQVLKGFKPSCPSFPEGCKFEELGNLSQLVTLEMVVDRDDKISGNELNALSKLAHLQHLTISCFNSYGSELVKRLDGLVLPKQLNEINLKYYPRTTTPPGLNPETTTPPWLNPTSLPELQYLSLCSGNFTRFHPTFYEGKQWWIVGLKLELLRDMEADWEDVIKVMPHLRLVNASWCPELKNFPIENFDFEGGDWRK